jgi:transcriptional regulator with XRE-family HTH domain
MGVIEWDRLRTEEIADKLRHFRTLAALTQEQLSGRIEELKKQEGWKGGMPASNISRYEAGKVRPGHEAIVKFLAGCGITEDAITTRVPPPPEPGDALDGLAAEELVPWFARAIARYERQLATYEREIARLREEVGQLRGGEGEKR